MEPILTRTYPLSHGENIVPGTRQRQLAEGASGTKIQPIFCLPNNLFWCGLASSRKKKVLFQIFSKISNGLASSDPGYTIPILP
jgi:hypothetical protein